MFKAAHDGWGMDEFSAAVVYQSKVSHRQPPLAMVTAQFQHLRLGFCESGTRLPSFYWGPSLVLGQTVTICRGRRLVYDLHKVVDMMNDEITDGSVNRDDR